MASQDYDSSGSSDDEKSPGRTKFQPPRARTLESMLEQDKEDESLAKYKKQLFGGVEKPFKIVMFPRDPRRAIPQRMTFVVPGRPDIDMDLTDLGALRAQTYVIKEGCYYRLKFYFFVQKEIVAGFKYLQTVHKKGIKIARTEFVAGSFGPKAELQCFTSGLEEIPSGFTARSSYTVKSLFTDIDQNEYLKWNWKLQIKKEWPPM